MTVASSPQLAAVLIARNEARCIARCIDSVRPFVDRVVVLDTGSTDGTPAIALAHGAEVHHMVWPDDFSAARNRALALADADWNLVIDADEWLLSGGEKLRAWCAGAPRLGQICQNSDNVDGQAATRSWITRLLPRGIRYEGSVHEQPVAALPGGRLALHLGHDGYHAAQLLQKMDRNRPLLLRDLAARPDDPYLLYQLGKDAEMRADDAAAGDYYAAAFAFTAPDANWRHELLIRYLHCLGQSGRRGEALALADGQMQQWRESPDFFFVLGNLLLDQGIDDPAGALDRWLPLAASAWERCLAIGERPDLQGSVHGRGSHLARYNLDLIRAQTAGLMQAVA
jgi:glycosyltransferase involved in cell wall biosynthesis